MSKKSLLLLILSAGLTGCSIPGAHLPTGDKNVAWEAEEQESLSALVNIYPVTPTLIKELKYQQQAVVTQPNLTLEQDIAHYEYHIGAGDVLNVTIWDHPELTIPAGSYRSSAEAGNWVHADGTIFYPYIGQVSVAGKTVTEVRTMLAEKLAKFIEAPQVDVNVAAFRSQKSYITGEVTSPGQQPISNIPLTLLDAVNRAGGITKDADWRNVTLTRNGVEEQISLYALIQKGDLTQNRLLRDGDIVHIPRNDAQKVFVMGEVKQPQMLKIDRTGMSLTEALSTVGGINEAEADATGIFVIRSNQERSNQNGIAMGQDEPIASIYQLNIQDATALVMGTEFELRPYDVVYVTAAPISRWNRLVRQLIPTISGFNEITEGALRVKNWP
ncbi:polysaccharide export protein [Vibrio cholerae]|uniref:polysaccharide export protein n=1 Tax=Vibrio cholerae TaxID=666 RepID=UPI0028D9FD5D|nr:polysaccharide export protein [Vibrio cholerae]EGQ9853970.1 polysaccharide export protein [Vibrio cholerae]ELJ8462261.1 polysaccharide export protein [Vibrio cholerae]MDV2383372.1 polysaccharide export protein [Vibrio cholerae]